MALANYEVELRKLLTTASKMDDEDGGLVDVYMADALMDILQSAEAELTAIRDRMRAAVETVVSLADAIVEEDAPAMADEFNQSLERLGRIKQAVTDELDKLGSQEHMRKLTKLGDSYKP